MFCFLSKIYKCQHSSWKKTLGTLAQKNITWDSQQRNKAVALKAEFLVVFAFLDIYNIFYGFLMEFLLREHCNNWMMNRLNFSDKLLPSHSHARTKSPTLLKRWPTKKTLRIGGSTALEKTCTLCTLFIMLKLFTLLPPLTLCILLRLLHTA